MFWDFYPWIDRQREPEPRIRKELTPRARVRIANSSKVLDGLHVEKGYERMKDYTGIVIDGFRVDTTGRAMASHLDFLQNDQNDIDRVLTYLEFVLNVALSDTDYQTRLSHDQKIVLIHKINRAFDDEGILVHVKPSASEIAEMGSYRPSNDELLQFQQVADETIIRADQEARTLALGDHWRDPLRPYNEAWKLYKDGVHTSDIIEKLYNSLELTTEKICSDLEDWEDSEQGVGRYLAVLKEKGIFEEGPQMAEEANHITQSLEATVHRLGGNRKRHKDIDPDYCVLVLHQVSAYLSFIIKRYEADYA